MNEKEPIKVKLTTVILSFVILILIFVIIGMYAYYHKSNTNNNAISDNSIKTKNPEVIQNDNKIEIIYILRKEKYEEENWSFSNFVYYADTSYSMHGYY